MTPHEVVIETIRRGLVVVDTPNHRWTFQCTCVCHGLVSAGTEWWALRDWQFEFCGAHRALCDTRKTTQQLFLEVCQALMVAQRLVDRVHAYSEPI